MTVKVRNISKWKQVQAADGLLLRANNWGGNRRIKIEFNCPKPTRIDALEGESGAFLANVYGLQTIEFVAAGDVELIFNPAMGEDLGEDGVLGEVFYYTDDGDHTAFARPEAVSLTKIMNRRARNPEMERMLFKAEQNVNRRIARLEAEFEERMAAIGHNPDTGEVNADENEEPDNADSGEASAAPETTTSEPEPPATGATTGTGTKT